MKLRMEKYVIGKNRLANAHWAVKHKEGKDWEWALRGATSKPLPRAEDKVKLRITSVRVRKLDYDGFVYGCYPILDALKRMGAIVDDSEKWLEVEYIQKKRTNGTVCQTIVEFL